MHMHTNKDMEQVTFVTKIAKSGAKIYINIPHDFRNDVAEKIGKQVKIIIEDI